MGEGLLRLCSTFPPRRVVCVSGFLATFTNWTALSDEEGALNSRRRWRVVGGDASVGGCGSDR